MAGSALRVEVLRSLQACQFLRRDWDEIMERQCSDISQLDLTSSFDWAMTLWAIHLQGREQEVLVLRSGNEIVGILPLYGMRRNIRRVSCRGLAPLTELYGGRSGFLLRSPQIEYLNALFACAERSPNGWDTFLVTVVEGSAHEKLLLGLARKKGWHSLLLAREESPYISFHENWESHFASLPKKLRSTMRNGEKRLRERGELAYRECRLEEEVREFNAAVDAIERDSWKAATGTSIASNPVHEAFHRMLALRATEKGWFSGHLLLLNAEPVAYVMGLLHQGVFLDLKESYRASFREMSPGHVLKSFAFARLYERGTRLYDFMGKCEEYKMKWTDRTYRRSSYLFFNRTLRGKLAWLLSQFGSSRAADMRRGKGPDIGGDQTGPDAGGIEASKRANSDGGAARAEK